METAMYNAATAEVLEETFSHHDECEIIEFRQDSNDKERDSLSENFNAEIDAWARRALAANGFGDY